MKPDKTGVPIQHIERLVKVESDVKTFGDELRELSGDVRSLTSTVRLQGDQTSSAIARLSEAVVRSTAPKETQWLPIISTVLSAVGIIVIIGGLVFWPIVRELNRLGAEFSKHESLKLHPVGEARIDALENALENTGERNAKAITALEHQLEKRAEQLASTTDKNAAAIQVQLESMRDRSIPPIVERLAILETKVNHGKH